MTDAPTRLYGIPGDEYLAAEPETVLEQLLADYDDDDMPRIIEEWDVYPPESHLPNAELLLELLSDRASDDTTEGWYECWSRDVYGDPIVTQAVELALAVIASKVTYRMARAKLRDLHVVHLDGEWVLSDTPPCAGQEAPPATTSPRIR